MRTCIDQKYKCKKEKSKFDISGNIIHDVYLKNVLQRYSGTGHIDIKLDLLSQMVFAT